MQWLKRLEGGELPSTFDSSKRINAPGDAAWIAASQLDRSRCRTWDGFPRPTRDPPETPALSRMGHNICLADEAAVHTFFMVQILGQTETMDTCSANDTWQDGQAFLCHVTH